MPPPPEQLPLFRNPADTILLADAPNTAVNSHLRLVVPWTRNRPRERIPSFNKKQSVGAPLTAVPQFGCQQKSLTRPTAQLLGPYWSFKLLNPSRIKLPTHQRMKSIQLIGTPIFALLLASCETVSATTQFYRPFTTDTYPAKPSDYQVPILTVPDKRTPLTPAVVATAMAQPMAVRHPLLTLRNTLQATLALELPSAITLTPC
jgi:hypothetical protein